MAVPVALGAGRFFGGHAVEAIGARFLPAAVGTTVGVGVGVHHATQGGDSPRIHLGDRKLEVVPPPARPESLAQSLSVQPPRTAKVFFQKESLAAQVPRDHILWSEQTDGGQSDRRVGEDRRQNGPESKPPKYDPDYVTVGLVAGAGYGVTKYLVNTPKQRQTMGGVVGSGLTHAIAGGLFGWSHLFSLIGVGAYAGSNLVDTFHASKAK